MNAQRNAGAETSLRDDPAAPGLVDSWWRAWAVLAATDPGLVRLRSAVTTVVSLAITAGVLVGIAAVAGQPATTAALGVVVAMVASFAVMDPTPAARALTTSVLVLAASATATLAAVVGPVPVWGTVMLVAVAMSAVLAQRMGPRGLAAGMVGFVAYFLVLFLRIPLSTLPVMILGAVVGAGASLGVRELLRSRHPDRELRRMLAAVGVRGGAVAGVLADVLRRGTFERADRWRLRVRMLRLREGTEALVDRLDSADIAPPDPAGDEARSVRVFDVQLGLEHLAATVVGALGDLSPVVRKEVAGELDALRDTLGGAAGPVPPRWRRPARDPARDPLLRLRDDVSGVDRAWRQAGAAPLAVSGEADPADRPGVAGPGDDAPASGTTVGGATDGADPDDGPGGAPAQPPAPWSATLRRVVQVGVATALAVVVGELLSPTYWFWAVIAAFVVFSRTSSRGDVLTQGWQRVAGTTAGVLTGVVVASLVGGRPVVAVPLIVICLFLGFYLMTVSTGLMVFFTTTMIALVYGLLDRFSVDLLLVRLGETVAGAAVGVASAYLLWPTRTRSTIATAEAGFLDDLRAVVDAAAATLAGRPDAPPPGSRAEPARQLRRSHAALRAAAFPLTDGIAGLLSRREHRQYSLVAASAEYHARALARLARRHGTLDTSAEVREALHVAAGEVSAGLARLTDRPAGTSSGDVRTSDALDSLDALAAVAEAPDDAVAAGAANHLRAIQRGVDAFAGHEVPGT